jgi:glucose/arabinose dehydrogenase
MWPWLAVIGGGLWFQAEHGPAVAQAGPVAAYSFDEGAGTTFADASGSGNSGTMSGATWAAGRFGTALSFNGTSAIANVPDSPSIDLTTGMTLEAWVNPVSLNGFRTVLLKERPGQLAYALYGNTDLGRPRGETFTSAGWSSSQGTSQLPLNTWSHLATTYDGTTLRLFVNGALTGSVATTGSLLVSVNPLRIGGNAIWGEYFNGRIDEVRIYNRALGAAELQLDMTQPISAADATPPTVSSVAPAADATNVSTAVSVTATFSEGVNATTVTGATVTLRDASGLIPAAVTYDAANRRATLAPVSQLAANAAYAVRILGGASGVKDAAGNPLAADFTWAFRTGTDSGTPVVVSKSPAPGATGAASTVHVAATFSEPMDAGSMAFVLRNQAGTLVPGTLTYDNTALAATLRPDVPLAATAWYTATIESAADVAGNAIAGPVSWVFRTGAAGFQQSTVLSGLVEPTAMEFASDGRVFVAEKSGLIKVFDSLSDTTPDVVADLRTKVHNFWDRGLLGLALDPLFPTRPYIYVHYTHDAVKGGTAPRWGSADETSDPCPSPPGPTANGCVVSGRVSRLELAGNVTISERVLIEDWPQQFPSHSVGGLTFGVDGYLYASGGDGANFNAIDYGQAGNPLGDPPVPAGGVQTPPTAEGGSLRSQDLRTMADPVGLNGTIVRVDPETGAAVEGNPLFDNADANAKRVIAYGLRNPYRFAFRPGTRDLYIADVGSGTWEEIDRIADTAATPMKNFGWPCYEGPNRQPGFEGANLNMCNDLYNQQDAVVSPLYAYRHGAAVVPGESCLAGTSSISALVFSSGGNYPASYRGALFFADYSRECIWVMFPDSAGIPDPSRIATLLSGAAGPVDLKIGPRGDLFYLDHLGGTVRRVEYFDGNRAPHAAASATPAAGQAPLTVTFDGSSSTDPDAGDVLAYAWDLDGDGFFDDGTAASVSFTYATARVYTARLRVTDNQGLSDIHATTISANSFAPVAAIQAPAASLTWTVGDVISFSGTAEDEDDGQLPPSAFSWSLLMHHCAAGGNCHIHPIQTSEGITEGSFAAPDHEYPSYLELVLKATDSSGLTDTRSVRLDPKTAALTFESDPAGVTVAVGSSSFVTPFTRTVILGSTNSVSAPSRHSIGGTSYEFSAWSDSGAQTHDIVADTASATYRATYASVPMLSIADATVTEGDAPGVRLSFDVTLSAPTARVVTVEYATTNGSAVAPADYAALSGTLTFPPGTTSRTIAVDVAGDSIDEASETIGITLANAVHAGLPAGPAAGTILDNDPAPSLSIDDTQVQEGDTGTRDAVLAVRLSSPSGLPVTVNYATAAGTASARTDFIAASGTLTIPSGATAAAVTAVVQGDTVAEPDETFVVNLSGPVNATITDGQGTAVIANDDAAAVPGLVAAYGFNEGTGTATADVSGNNNAGAVSGAAWMDGKAGKALSFDGVNDIVTVNDSSSLDLTTAFTIGLWVNPRTLNGWRTLVLKERSSGVAYGMYANTSASRPNGEIYTSAGSIELTGTAPLALNRWTYLAVTYDGLALRYFVDGAQVSSRAASGAVLVSGNPLRVGGNLVWGEYFDGLMDELRIYNRALAPAEIQADMNTAVSGEPLPDTTAPARSNGQPSGTLPSGTTSAVLQITTDEAATCRYGTAPGTGYAAMATTFSTTGGSVHTTTVGGLGSGASYAYYVRCVDAAGNPNTTDATISFSIASPWLVAAYGFDEGTGTTLGDSSGNGRHGTIANATWLATGRYGKALLFNGTNASVSIADAAPLDLTNGMTLEAWVQPNAGMGQTWRSVLMKERASGLSYALYANGESSRPSADINTGGTDQHALGAAVVVANVWTHLASTFDGTTLRLYVNGALVQSKPVSGSIVTSTGALRIGGNSIWGEYFNGTIDEVRIYNRALTAAEIVSDMNAAIVP